MKGSRGLSPLKKEKRQKSPQPPTTGHRGSNLSQLGVVTTPRRQTPEIKKDVQKVNPLDKLKSEWPWLLITVIACCIVFWLSWMAKYSFWFCFGAGLGSIIPMRISYGWYHGWGIFLDEKQDGIIVADWLVLACIWCIYWGFLYIISR